MRTILKTVKHLGWTGVIYKENGKTYQTLYITELGLAPTIEIKRGKYER